MGWGHVDGESAALALGITIPLAILVSVAILAVGMLMAPPRSASNMPAKPMFRILHGGSSTPAESGAGRA